MYFLGSLGWTKNGQVFKEFSIQLIIYFAYLQVQTQQLTPVKGYTSHKRNCVDVLVLLPVNMLFQVPSIGKMKRKINPKNR